MKKSNEKGFLLAEAIVVGVFVLSLFTFLFANVVPLIGQYEAQEKYDTIDSVYNANLIRSMIMGDANGSKVLKLKDNTGVDTIYQDYSVDTLCNKLEQKNYCRKLLNSTFLDVNTVYVTWYRTSKIKAKAKNSPDFPRAVRDYIEEMDKYTQPTGSTYDSYKRIIVYFNDGTLANLEVRMKEE